MAGSGRARMDSTVCRCKQHHSRPVLVQAGDRARKNLDHHPDYILAAYMTSGT